MKNTKGLIFDIDGVLKYHGKVLPDAIETIDALRKKEIILRFMTNSTLKSRESCAEDLQSSGFTISSNEIITASYATAKYLEGIQPKSCWIMLESKGLDEFKNFAQDMDNPEYIVIGDNRSKFDFEHMNMVLRLLLKGAKLIGMTPDPVDSSMGEPELNVGSWVNMLEKASGVKATYIGKPSFPIYEITLKTTGLNKEETVMVGDRISTDIQGAHDFGMRSILLRTGEFNEDDLNGDVKPDFVFDSIGDILSLLL
jgi:HAD superfamily hydrolase (TIGR01458 family)